MVEPKMKRRKPSLSAQEIRLVRETGPLGRYVGSQVRLTHIAALNAFEAQLAPFRSSATRFALLDQLSELRSSTQGTLADILDIDRTTLVPMLASMERQGLIMRTSSARDRRTLKVEMTAKGRELLRKLQPIAAAHEQRLCRGMTETEKSAFIKTLRRVRRNLTES